MSSFAFGTGGFFNSSTTTHNAAAVITIPLVGYVSADTGPGGNVWLKNGVYDPNYLSTRFKVSVPAKGAPFTLTPSASTPTVYQDEFVNWVKTMYPTLVTNPKTPVFFDLDNEPDLWSSTHLEIHGNPAVLTGGKPTPVPVTYAELLSKSIAMSTAIKNVMPTSKVLGPVNYGFLGMWNLQNASDRSIAGATGAWTGQLDLGNNSLILKSAGATVRNTIANQIRQGMGLTTVVDSGHHGLTSSTALANPTGDTTLGYALASDLSATPFTFAGQTVSGNDVLIKYTWKADANLDGLVNVADLGILATNYGLSGKSWASADFNGDGFVNVADLGLLATYYGHGTSPGTPLLAFQDALSLFPQFGGTSDVPEPATLTLLALATLPLLTRRRGNAAQPSPLTTNT